MVLERIWAFLKLTRPTFLLGGVMLHTLGAMMAALEGAALQPGRLILGQVLVTSIQLMTHYANEYYDIQGDGINTARTWFSGGSGVLSAGLFSPDTARRAALLAAGVAVIALIVISVQAPLVFFLGAFCLLAAWYYSAPPLSLSGSGWGELSASLIVAFMVPVVGYAMQTGGYISLTLLIACLPLILIHFAMLLAFQIPDRQADQQVGKRTLAVRLGLEQVTRLHNGLLLIACATAGALILLHWPGLQLIWLAAPLAAWQIYWITRYGARSSPRSSGRSSDRYREQLSGRPPYLWLTMGALALFALTTALWLAGAVLVWMGI